MENNSDKAGNKPKSIIIFSFFFFFYFLFTLDVVLVLDVMVLVVLFPSPMVTNIMNIMGISFILFRLCFFIFDVLCLKWIQCERIHYSRIACNFIIIVIPSESAMVPFFSVSRAYFTRPIFYRLYSSFVCVYNYCISVFDRTIFIKTGFACGSNGIVVSSFLIWKQCLWNKTKIFEKNTNKFNPFVWIWIPTNGWNIT